MGSCREGPEHKRPMFSVKVVDEKPGMTWYIYLWAVTKMIFSKTLEPLKSEIYLVPSASRVTHGWTRQRKWRHSSGWGILGGHWGSSALAWRGRSIPGLCLEPLVPSTIRAKPPPPPSPHQANSVLNCTCQRKQAVYPHWRGGIWMEASQVPVPGREWCQGVTLDAATQQGHNLRSPRTEKRTRKCLCLCLSLCLHSINWHKSFQHLNWFILVELICTNGLAVLKYYTHFFRK